MNTAAPSRWRRVLRQCARHVEGRWPERPVAEKPSVHGLQAGFLFSGQCHETVPRRLLLDNRLTPLERNAWQVLRMLLDGQGLVTPRYEDLQPYLSAVPYGASASRETVARVLTMLRLTRWLSLVARGRDQVSGRLQGSLYVLHDEPLTPAEAMELDQEYLELVGRCLSHATKVVRIVARHVLEEIREDTDIDHGQLPTRLDTWGERWARQGLDQPEALHESELGDQPPVRIRAAPGSDAESGAQPSIDDAVRHPNPACTVLKASICTVPRASPAVDNLVLHWPDTLHLSPNERHAATIALSKLKQTDRQAVLNEVGARCAAGGIRKPAAYLMGLIQRALRGEFHPWAGQMWPQTTVDTATTLPQLPSRTQGEPISPLAQACLDELRQLRGNRPGPQ